MCTVVYLPGVWDLMHPGHINVIRRAKNCGDYLIVGVCSDRLVCDTKGPPVNPAHERMAMLAEIKGVDEVHMYDDLDQSGALDMFRVSVFAVGSDFGSLAQHQSALSHCREKGIKVVVIPRYPGVSTTSIKQRVLRCLDANNAPENDDLGPGCCSRSGLASDQDGLLCRASKPLSTAEAPTARDRNLNLGVDYHDTLSFAPTFFKALFSAWPGKRYIVTGTPASARDSVVAAIRAHGLVLGEDYDEILLGFEYSKDKMGVSHFMRMRQHKYELLQRHDISVFFDDNPFYVDFMKDKGIQTFQTILPTEYIAKFGRADPFFTCHLQERQFESLHALRDSGSEGILKEKPPFQSNENVQKVDQKQAH